MTRISRLASAVVLLTAALAGTAAAERTLPVSDNNTGVFDQPSTVLNGSVVNVAFIGDNTGSGNYRVFYAAVNGGADFTNLALPRDNTVILTFPTVVDNTTPPNDSYSDARHPKIALRSATEVVVLFQAKPTAADVVYRPYIARLTLANNAVTGISVRRVGGFPPGVLSTGDMEDISYGLVPADNTARMAFASRSTISAAAPFQVYFARVGLDNATAVGTPVRLSSGDNNTVTGSDGFRPIPALRLDAANRSHVAWAANDSTPNPGGVYYALVKDTGGVDNVAIGATEVLGRTLSWGHPSVLVSATNSIIILAVDESIAGKAGNIGMVNVNPDAVTQNGLPVSIGTIRSFLLLGPSVLPSTFDLYRPEAFLDGNARIHMTGYGISGSSATYYSMKLTSSAPFAEFVTAPTPVGLNEFPAELAGDYTKAAFQFLNGKTMVFWSGLIPGSANRNLNVTTVPAVLDVSPAKESGCSMVGDPRAGEAGRIPGAFLLFLPAAVLAVRRMSRRLRRTPRRSVAN